MTTDNTSKAGHIDDALITFVLDESGSMGNMEDAAREAFNEFLQEQINHGGRTWWTLVTFNSHINARFEHIPGAEVRPLRGPDYQPSAMTALYDALGDAITATQKRLVVSEDRGHPSDVIVVVMTDGMENASRRWTHKRIFDLVTECEQAGWQFIFLGANQDSWAVADRLGMRHAAVSDFSPDAPAAMRGTDDANYAASTYRTSKVQQDYYSDHRGKSRYEADEKRRQRRGRDSSKQPKK
jgi:hypothetical protein